MINNNKLYKLIGATMLAVCVTNNNVCIAMEKTVIKEEKQSDLSGRNIHEILRSAVENSDTKILNNLLKLYEDGDIEVHTKRNLPDSDPESYYYKDGAYSVLVSIFQGEKHRIDSDILWGLLETTAVTGDLELFKSFWPIFSLLRKSLKVRYTNSGIIRTLFRAKMKKVLEKAQKSNTKIVEFINSKLENIIDCELNSSIQKHNLATKSDE